MLYVVVPPQKNNCPVCTIGIAASKEIGNVSNRLKCLQIEEEMQNFRQTAHCLVQSQGRPPLLGPNWFYRAHAGVREAIT